MSILSYKTTQSVKVFGISVDGIPLQHTYSHNTNLLMQYLYYTIIYGGNNKDNIKPFPMMRFFYRNPSDLHYKYVYNYLTVSDNILYEECMAYAIPNNIKLTLLGDNNTEININTITPNNNINIIYKGYNDITHNKHINNPYMTLTSTIIDGDNYNVINYSYTNTNDIYIDTIYTYIDNNIKSSFTLPASGICEVKQLHIGKYDVYDTFVRVDGNNSDSTQHTRTIQRYKLGNEYSRKSIYVYPQTKTSNNTTNSDGDGIFKTKAYNYHKSQPINIINRVKSSISTNINIKPPIKWFPYDLSTQDEYNDTIVNVSVSSTDYISKVVKNLQTLSLGYSWGKFYDITHTRTNTYTFDDNNIPYLKIKTEFIESVDNIYDPKFYYKSIDTKLDDDNELVIKEKGLYNHSSDTYKFNVSSNYKENTTTLNIDTSELSNYKRILVNKLEGIQIVDNQNAQFDVEIKHLHLNIVDTLLRCDVELPFNEVQDITKGYPSLNNDVKRGFTNKKNGISDAIYDDKILPIKQVGNTSEYYLDCMIDTYADGDYVCIDFIHHYFSNYLPKVENKYTPIEILRLVHYDLWLFQLYYSRVINAPYVTYLFPPDYNHTEAYTKTIKLWEFYGNYGYRLHSITTLRHYISKYVRLYNNITDTNTLTNTQTLEMSYTLILLKEFIRGILNSIDAFYGEEVRNNVTYGLDYSPEHYYKINKQEPVRVTEDVAERLISHVLLVKDFDPEILDNATSTAVTRKIENGLIGRTIEKVKRLSYTNNSGNTYIGKITNGKFFKDMFTSQMGYYTNTNADNPTVLQPEDMKVMIDYIVRYFIEMFKYTYNQEPLNYQEIQFIKSFVTNTLNMMSVAGKDIDLDEIKIHLDIDKLDNNSLTFISPNFVYIPVNNDLNVYKDNFVTGTILTHEKYF